MSFAAASSQPPALAQSRICQTAGAALVFWEELTEVSEVTLFSRR
jgi:hypothetical protein